VRAHYNIDVFLLSDSAHECNPTLNKQLRERRDVTVCFTELAAEGSYSKGIKGCGVCVIAFRGRVNIKLERAEEETVAARPGERATRYEAISVALLASRLCQDGSNPTITLSSIYSHPVSNVAEADAAYQYVRRTGRSRRSAQAASTRMARPTSRGTALRQGTALLQETQLFLTIDEITINSFRCDRATRDIGADPCITDEEVAEHLRQEQADEYARARAPRLFLTPEAFFGLLLIVMFAAAAEARRHHQRQKGRRGRGRRKASASSSSSRSPSQSPSDGATSDRSTDEQQQLPQQQQRQQHLGPPCLSAGRPAGASCKLFAACRQRGGRSGAPPAVQPQQQQRTAAADPLASLLVVGLPAVLAAAFISEHVIGTGRSSASSSSNARVPTAVLVRRAIADGSCQRGKEEAATSIAAQRRPNPSAELPVWVRRRASFPSVVPRAVAWP
jgi:hypothetical protein